MIHASLLVTLAAYAGYRWYRSGTFEPEPQKAHKQSNYCPPWPAEICVVCGGDTVNFFRPPCRDVYCISCLCELFEHATKDESLMPPRCCRQEIPFDSVASYLPAPLGDIFKRKLEEHNTPNRLYCTKPSCAAFIGSADGQRRTLHCPKCLSLVCSSCKKEAHPPHTTCNEDKETEYMIKFCREQGWQSCPSCQRMIELTHGCYHMTCLCGTKFCYLCRRLWTVKGCPCTERDDQRLRFAAEVRVRDEIRRAASLNATLPIRFNDLLKPTQPPNLTPSHINDRPIQQTELPWRIRNPTVQREKGSIDFAARVRATMERLRETHHCQHSHWSKEWGAAACESCFDRLDEFIMRCRDCAMQACVRCRRNRLV